MQQPASDPNYESHPVHGIHGQTSFFTAVMRHVRQRRVAVDAGAHIGIWTRLMAASFREVYAFEPVLENFDCLRANTHDLKNVARFQVALGAHKDQVDMTLDEGCNSGTWHVKPIGNTPLVTLDRFCVGMLCNVDLMKIDVEGFEGFVISGAVETIKRDKPVVVFEDNGLGTRYYESDWLDPKEVLEKIGYRRVLRIRKDEVWSSIR